jgi:hypothetical protein
MAIAGARLPDSSRLRVLASDFRIITARAAEIEPHVEE